MLSYRVGNWWHLLKSKVAVNTEHIASLFPRLSGESLGMRLGHCSCVTQFPTTHTNHKLTCRFTCKLSCWLWSLVLITLLRNGLWRLATIPCSPLRRESGNEATCKVEESLANVYNHQMTLCETMKEDVTMQDIQLAVMKPCGNMITIKFKRKRKWFLEFDTFSVTIDLQHMLWCTCQETQVVLSYIYTV